VKLSEWAKYFEDVRGAFFHPGDSTMRGGLIFTHVPVHPSCLSGHYLGNVHGHLHCHQIIDDGKVDRRYYNACVERHDFYPVALEDIKAFFKGHDRTRTFNTPIREPWNPIIYSLLKAIDNHMALYLRHRDLWHLRKAAMLREYVHEIKAYILRLEEL
jgi:hypothetical protein